MKKRFLASILTISMMTSVLAVFMSAPTTAYASTPEYVQANKTYQVGDTVYFGNYWQNDTNNDGTADQNDTKEPIEWRVLSQNGDDLFLMATKGLDAQPYNETRTEVTWETCTLRTWLNDEFYNNAFSDSEQNAIKTTTLENADNPSFDTEGGNSTNDKVFLLNLEDVTNTSYGFSSSYSTYDTKRQIKATEYAADRNTNVSTSGGYAGNCRWWLRSPGYSSKGASIVNYDGYVFRNGLDVDYTYGTVCPALHINLKSINPTPEASNPASPTVTPTPTEATKIPTIGDYEYRIKSDGTLEITKYTGTASILEVPSSIDGYMVSQIGARAFANNDLMESLILPDTIKTIGSNAFESCRKLVSVSLGSGVETIKERAFYNCPALSLIAIPESVKNIGENAFGYDSSNKLVFGFSIIGFSGTTAEKYASENGVSFNNLGAGDKPSTQKKVTLKFTKKSAKIKRGKKVTLKVKLTGAKKATFSVDKKGKKVVKLSKKKAKSVVVTGKKKGKAVITAKAAGKTAKCKVTVK